MIINRADRFGLAQLHQLRGRVGRSHHQAYAYLLINSYKTITKDALKRLEAIESLEELGAGFMLATHDLEIRGAGELLGEEQSGHIQAIGFSLYNELLEQAVNSLKAGKEFDLEKPLHHGAEIDLHMTALIPETWVPDVHTRLTLYKRIANAKDSDELRELQVEMIDRFGLLPEATKNLFRIAELKIKAQQLGIRKIDVGETSGRIEFEAEPNIDLKKLLQLIQKDPKNYKLDSLQRLQFTLQNRTTASKIDQTELLLDNLKTQ
jgi:transcription-repair coupling factor (superfamily II helicase)